MQFLRRMSIRPYRLTNRSNSARSPGVLKGLGMPNPKGQGPSVLQFWGYLEYVYIYVHFVYGTLFSVFTSLIFDFYACVIWFHVVVVVCLGLAAYSFVYFYIFKIILLLFVFFRSYSFLFAVLRWPVQWASMAFLVTWNKYDDDDTNAHTPTVWPRTTKFGIVTHMREGRVLEG